MSRVTVIIVNWNSGALLRRCLDALPAAFHPQPQFSILNSQCSFDVTVVDNASTDDSVALGQGSPQAFRLIASKKNLGFARATNLALRHAAGDVVLLLNPDTEPRPGSLLELLAAFERHPRAGILGPTLRSPDGSRQPSVRGFPTLAALVLTLTRLARVFPRLPAMHRYLAADVAADVEAPVDQVMGACFAVRRAVLDAIGFLDEGYWIWFEEVDFCRRAKTHGWETWFIPSSVVLHHRAAAFRQVSPLVRSCWFARSALRYARKHLGLAATAVVILVIPLHLLTGLGASAWGLTSHTHARE